MFKNRSTILITVGVLVAIAISLKLLTSQETEVSNSLKAVPEDAALVIETNQFYSLIKNIKGNQFRQEFSGMEQLKGFFNDSEYLDSLITSHSEFQELLQNNRVIVSGHISANNVIEFLYVIPLKDKKSFEKINTFIDQLVSNDATIRQRMYEGYTINDVVYFREEIKPAGFSYAYSDGLFIFSLSKIQVEASLRRLKNNFSLANDNSFKKLMESSGKNVDANLYINYKYTPNIFKNILRPGNAEFYEFISSFASWSELDLIFKKDAFLMSGFTLIDDSLDQYLNLFKDQSTLENEFLDVLPGNTSTFIAFNLSDPEKWGDQYFRYLNSVEDYPEISNELSRFDQKYGKDKWLFLYKNIEGSVSSVWINSGDKNQEALAIVQVKDDEAMQAEMQFMRERDSLKKEPVVVEQNSGLSAYYFPEPKLFKYLFGKAFQNVNAQWYIHSKGFFVFGSSIQVLKNYIHNIKSGVKLKDDKDFAEFSKSMSSESNLFLYSHIGSSNSLITSELNDKYLGIFNKNSEKFNKIEALSIQFGSNKNLLSTNVYLGFNPQLKKLGNNVWEVPVDNQIICKPKIVKSHLTGNNEIVIQDNAFNLILISEYGKILWKKKLSGKILGDIYQIDLFKNGKYQFLFNTKESLYMVDRNGKDVEDYPIRLKSPATNGMAVFDYDKNKTYRILIACENKSVYLLNTNGSKVDGWAFNQTESEVLLPAKHFVSDSKDYIVFGDKTNTYILNRRGETRILVKSKFEKNPTSEYFFEKGKSEAEGRFITTGIKGDIFFVFLDGQVKKMTLDDFSPGHQFIYDDLDGNGQNQYIIADKNKLYVFNGDKSVKFEKKFDGPIENTVNLYNIDKNAKYIGVSPSGENNIFLLNAKGSTVKGFPKQGSGPFSIAKLLMTGKGTELNLITGSDENYLINYNLGTPAAE